ERDCCSQQSGQTSTQNDSAHGALLYRVLGGGDRRKKETVTVIFYIYKSHLFIWLFHMEIYRASL
ncbi:hypothetical protein, partial [Pseudomonas viridiflava]|uniref:hypothetical protein n=1 Tax=Pseudomonas viridiflava TaxID=33069 RepID=UPI0019D24F97